MEQRPRHHRGVQEIAWQRTPPTSLERRGRSWTGRDEPRVNRKRSQIRCNTKLSSAISSIKTFRFPQGWAVYISGASKHDGREQNSNDDYKSRWEYHAPDNYESNPPYFSHRSPPQGIVKNVAKGCDTPVSYVEVVKIYLTYFFLAVIIGVVFIISIPILILSLLAVPLIFLAVLFI